MGLREFFTGSKTDNAASLIRTLQRRGLNLSQIADSLPADDLGRAVSRVTLSKILHGDRSGVQLMGRLQEMAGGKPTPTRKTGKRQRGVPEITAPRKTPSSAQELPAPPRMDHRQDYPTPAEVGQPAYIKGRHIGWIDAAGKLTKEPPTPPKTSHASRSLPRVVLHSAPPSLPPHPTDKQRDIYGYQMLRDVGLSDAGAQAILATARAQRQQQRQQSLEARTYAANVASLAATPAYQQRAFTWLMRAGGSFTPAQQRQKARELAEHDLHSQQDARLPDDWKWTAVSDGRRFVQVAVPSTGIAAFQLAAPGYPTIVAPPTSVPILAWAKNGQNARGLGDSRGAVREVFANATHDQETRSRMAQKAEMLSNATQVPPTIGTPARLGVPVEEPPYLTPRT